MRRNAAGLIVDGRPITWLGANFWSRTGGPLMWRNYQPDVVGDELRVLRDHGLNMTRSFFYWPDFMPAPDKIDDQLVGHFADFLDRHAAVGMSTVPTFLVGHMSGENWDPAWRAGRDLYSDVWMVARQAWFAGEMVRRFGSHPAVSGWLVSNEMPLYGEPATREAVSSWAQIVIDAVHAAGGRQPVSLGDGGWGIEITGRDNGFSVRDSARLCDFLGPHVYPMGDDVARVHYAAAWACEMASTFGIPVVLEEFGLSSDFAAEDNAAQYYRQVLHNSLLAGATGWIAWNNTDFDKLREQDPYRHHPFELHFGLTDVSGRPKRQLAEMRDFADTLRAVDFDRCHRTDSDAVLVVPSCLDTAYPFAERADGPSLHDTLRQAYVSARLADVPVALSRESDGIDHSGRLYLLPSTKQLLSPTWYELEQLAADGATVYVSYSAGPHGNQRGPWYAHMNELFGVRHQLRYGLINPIEDDTVTFTLTQPFGSLTEGARLAFQTGGTQHSRAFLPVEPVDAEVLAVDQRDRPALLRRRVGPGSVILCTYPLEHMAAMTPAVNPDSAPLLYDALAVHAGVRRLVTVDDPRVAVDLLRHNEGHLLAWLVSQADSDLQVEPNLANGLELCDLNGNLIDGSLTLPPYGVRVLRVNKRTDRAGA